MDSKFVEDLIKSQIVPLPQGKTTPLNSGVSIAEGKFIEKIILKERPARTLEIGCRFGISSHFFCRAMRAVNGSEHVIIDAGQRVGVQNAGLWNLLNEGYGDLLTCYAAKSQIVLPMLLGRGVFDVSLIDGAHTFDHTLVDFFYIDQITKVGGIVIFDDADWEAIRPVCSFLANNRAYEVIDFVGREREDQDFFASNSSMVAFRKKENDGLPRHGAWDFHAQF